MLRDEGGILCPGKKCTVDPRLFPPPASQIPADGKTEFSPWKMPRVHNSALLDTQDIRHYEKLGYRSSRLDFWPLRTEDLAMTLHLQVGTSVYKTSLSWSRPGPRSYLGLFQPRQPGTCAESAEIINSLNDHLTKGGECIDLN